MQNENMEAKDQEEVQNEQTSTESTEEQKVENQETEAAEEKEELSEVDQLKAEVAESKDKYLRLYSEFENFRRRTSKEKLELIGTANKELMSALLPVLDDFERAKKAQENKADGDAAIEGMELIYNKFKKTLENKGLKLMDVEKGSDFSEDFHEAITQIPAGEEMAGKIVDVIENGYILDEKIVRFAKVVTGAKS